jgi:OOP family OmpA-OmpF porin
MISTVSFGQAAPATIKAHFLIASASASLSFDLRGVEFKPNRPSARERLSTSLKDPVASSFEILDEAVETLKRNPEIRIQVNGHANTEEGSIADRLVLSERRAKLVYDYLISHGVPRDQLDGPKGFGSSEPIDTNDTEEGRQRNARVELYIQ